MMKKILILSLWLFLPLNSAFAEDRLVVLKDGSQIQGKIVSYQDGVYVIRSSSLGELRLVDQQVQSISTLAPDRSLHSGNLVSPAPAKPRVGGVVESAQGALLGGSLAQIQAQIASDPGLMSTILQLQNDPDMKALLADPEVMRAIQQFDMDALSANPRIQKLLRSQKFKDIESRVSP